MGLPWRPYGLEIESGSWGLAGSPRWFPSWSYILGALVALGFVWMIT